MNEPGQIVEAERIGEKLFDPCRPISGKPLLRQDHSKEPIRVLVPPGIGLIFEPPPGGPLPLGLGRETERRPRRLCEPLAVGHGIEPAHPDGGLAWVLEKRVVPKRRRGETGRVEKAGILGIRDRRDPHLKAVLPHAVAGAGVWKPSVPTHPEFPCGNRDHSREWHAGQYSTADSLGRLGPIGLGYNGNMEFADRMGRLGTESAFEVLSRAKELERKGRAIIHLEIGEPDFDTPEHIRVAAKQALDEGATRYGPSAGLPELREAVAAHVAETRGILVTADEVVVTPGAKPIMFFTILALVNRGDEVIVPDPGFPIYESVVNFVGGVPVPIPLVEERGFGFDMSELERRVSKKTKLIILNSPHNPTGGVLERDELGRIAELARHYRVPVLSDEIYRDFLYDGTFASIITFPGMKALTILLDGFSKSYAMTGWRLGYGVMPRPLAEEIARLMVNSASCTNSFVQRAGIAALRGDQGPVRKMVAEFQRRRDLIVEGLRKFPGVSCARPRGAFYVFPSVKALGRPSREIAERLLEEAGVALLWGSAFGIYGEGYLRLSYATSAEKIREALARMGEVWPKLSRER